MNADLVPGSSTASASSEWHVSGAPGPIFIGGLDRSGKTTMRAFLTSHPNVAIPAVGSNMETYFYGRFGDLAAPRNLDRCLGAMLRYKHVRFLRPDPERIRREFRAGPATYERLFSLFLIHHAEREGKPRWGAQTSLIERYADELFASFPEAKVVHMVRDPRDRYAASLELWPDGRGRAGGATARWSCSMRLAELNLRRYPDAYLVVRFEDLLRDPEACVREVCAFVGETFDPVMLDMPDAPEHRKKLAGGHPSDEVALSTTFIGRYRQVVPRRELMFMQGRLAERMRAYGYTPEPLRPTLGERVSFWALEWPSQSSRMTAWRMVEWFQQRFPSVVPRRPGSRMIVDPEERP